MKNFATFAFIAIIMILLVWSINYTDKKESTTLEQKVSTFPSNLYPFIYAGRYSIEVIGVSSDTEVEAYALYESGQAICMRIVNDGYGNANVKSEKKGTWTAGPNKISISIQGNTGIINEDYVFRDGRFVNTENSKRYMKRMEYKKLKFNL